MPTSRALLPIAALTLLVFAGPIGCCCASKSGDSASTLEQNKATALAFYRTAFNDHKPEEAVAKYVGDKYTQHNPQAADGKQAFIDFVNAFAKANPGLHIEVKRVVAEGDLVAVHVHLTLSPTDRGTAAIDFFRLENGKVVEHWDSVQPVPEKAANSNGMF
jgi:predicted SnoaL-like aldol condensation-catalyzing enzyme